VAGLAFQGAVAPLTEQGTLVANYFSPVEKLENRVSVGFTPKNVIS
jgi:hypothetical protein